MQLIAHSNGYSCVQNEFKISSIYDVLVLVSILEFYLACLYCSTAIFSTTFLTDVAPPEDNSNVYYHDVLEMEWQLMTLVRRVAQKPTFWISG